MLPLLACPHPERGTNGTQCCDCEPDALNTPDGARSRFQGVARKRARDDADRIADRRLTLDRCLDQVSACETRHLKSSQATARSTTTSLHEFASLTPRAGYFFAS